MNGDDIQKTVISREYPSEWKPGDEPFYPVNDERNNALYEKYAVSGERCHIYDVDIEKDEQIYDVDSLKRIAEEISYIDGPEGDIPNVQINGWRFANSQAIPLEDKLDLSFHMKSLPGARLGDYEDDCRKDGLWKVLCLGKDRKRRGSASP